MQKRIRYVEVDTVCHGGAAVVLTHWNRARGDRFAPAFGRDFHLDDLPVDIIPSLTVVDVLRGGEDYFYRFWGTESVVRKGFEMTGKRLSEAPTREGRKIGFEQYGAVLAERKPLAIVYNATYLSSAAASRQLTFRFPLSGDGERIDKIITYQNLRQHPADWEDLYDEMWLAAGQPVPNATSACRGPPRGKVQTRSIAGLFSA